MNRQQINFPSAGKGKMSDASAGQKAAAETPEQAQQRQVQALLRAPIPKVYANGLATIRGVADMSIVFLNHNAPAAFISMSFSTAKSVAQDILKAIQQFENSTGEKVKDIKELSAAAQQRNNAK